MSQLIDNWFLIWYNPYMEQPNSQEHTNSEHISPISIGDASIAELQEQYVTTHKSSAFTWTEQTLSLLAMIVEGRYAAYHLAMATGLSTSAIREIRNNPVFQQAVAQAQEKFVKQVLEIGLARKTERVKLLADRLERIQCVVEERAAAASPEAAEAYGIKYDEALAQAPGGSSGLVVHDLKVVGTGRNTMIIDEYKVDTGTLATEAALTKQLAQELGQFTEKTETTQVKKLYIGVSLEDI